MTFEYWFPIEAALETNFFSRAMVHKSALNGTAALGPRAQFLLPIITSLRFASHLFRWRYLVFASLNRAAGDKITWIQGLLRIS